jgi:uncharacterized protein (TIGR01244 family)
LLDKVEPALDDTFAAYRKMIGFMVADTAAKMAAEEGGGPDAERLDAFVTELMSLMSVQGLRDAGIDRDSLFAIYGDGLLPVVRFALGDGAKFDAAIARLEDTAQQKFEVGELKGTSYRYRDFEKLLRVVIATPGDDAVMAIVPVAYDEDRLARTLGIVKPRKNLAKSKEFRKIAKEYGFTDHVVGFIDVKKIAASFLGDPSGLNREVLALMEYDAAQLDETCRAEIAGLAGIAPRIVMGYTEVDDERIEAAMIVELREDVAAGLSTLPAAVPGLGDDPGGLFSFGFSLDPMALRNFYESRLDAMENDPFECARLGELQASTVKGREALAQPLPPVVYNFRGMLATVRDVTGFDLAGKQPPESIDASILFAIENAQDIVNMGALMNPQIAAMNLLPDGAAKKLDLPELGELAKQAYAALTKSGLAVALGDGAEQRAAAMHQADVVSSQPIMSMNLDARRYYEFVGEAMLQPDESAEEDPAPDEVRQAVREIMTSSGAIYERTDKEGHRGGNARYNVGPGGSRPETMMRRYAVLLLMAVTSLAAADQHPAGPVKVDLEQVVAAGQVRPVNGITAAGQPDERAFSVFADSGYVVVIDMRTAEEDRGLDEPATVSALGMEYVPFPIDRDDITLDKASEFDALLAGYEGPVLVHCASSNRVGALFALREFLDSGDAARALEVGRDAGMTRLEKTVRKVLESEQ